MPSNRGRRGRDAAPEQHETPVEVVATFRVVSVDQETESDGSAGGDVLTLQSVELDAASRPPAGFSFPPGSYRLVLAAGLDSEVVAGQTVALALTLRIMPPAPIAPEDVLPSEP